ncbi:hypothetical protein P280DRAFT_45981 [Massarina eburnea CBS 473.64]|uniref:Secreted protein n=1 Tax=Massarina eburnea CBS 473.64 TaxID=1395130 RepID=A0A6A6S0H3_9PLEO|nr:hypothetical protein P280DRAFT_45981 [Massarina eburnea CBS 473.64]
MYRCLVVLVFTTVTTWLCFEWDNEVENKFVKLGDEYPVLLLRYRSRKHYRSVCLSFAFVTAHIPANRTTYPTAIIDPQETRVSIVKRVRVAVHSVIFVECGSALRCGVQFPKSINEPQHHINAQHQTSRLLNRTRENTALSSIM